MSSILSNFKEANTTVDLSKEIQNTRILPSELKTGVYLTKITDAYLYVADSGSLQGVLILDILDETTKSIITQIKTRFTLSNKAGKFVTERGYPLVGLSNFLGIYSLVAKQVNSLLQTSLQPFKDNPYDKTRETERFVDLVGKVFYAGLVKTKSRHYLDETREFIEPELVKWFNSNKQSLFEVIANKTDCTDYNKFLATYPEDYVNDRTGGRVTSTTPVNNFKEVATPKDIFISSSTSTNKNGDDSIPF